MSLKLKRIASVLIVLCLTFVFLHGLTALTESKASREKYMHFFKQEADFDVLFVGSSKVINGILPMELWNDYGIVSYNLGGHDNAIPISYWVLRNALDHTTPKCVVFDCMGSAQDSWISSQSYFAHMSFDAFPLSQNKIQAIYELVGPGDGPDVQQKRFALLWNFATYHSRWGELNMNDLRPRENYQKGAEQRINVSVPVEMETADPNKRNSLESRNMQYLIKTIELCQARGIDLILIHTPYPAGESELIAANTVGDVADTYGLEYYNFLTTDVVNYPTDMHDPNSHLNPSGAIKLTNYLGKVLSEKYNIPDQRNNPDYQDWHKDSKMYYQEKTDFFVNAASAWNYWMLLSDDDFSFVAEISESDVREDQMLDALLRNAGIAPERVSGRYIIAANRITGNVTYTEYEALSQGAVETALGTLLLENGCLKLEDQICWQLADAESAAMNFALLDPECNLIDSASFSWEDIQASPSDSV